MKDKAEQGDQHVPACGICIDEFEEIEVEKQEADQEADANPISDLEIVKPPQCDHYFHRKCLL